MRKNYLYSIATLAGTIIGGGLFAVPLVVSKAGIIPFLIYILLLGLVQFLLHTIYAEIILSSKQKHRMPGYVGVYCGKQAKNWTLFFSIIGKHGSLLAYILLGGSFLYALLGSSLGGNLFIYTTALFVLESLIVFFGLRLIAGVELALSTLLVALIFLIGFKSVGDFELGKLVLINKDHIFLPYGPVFFAVGGQAAIPEICRLLKNQKQKIKGAIAWGTLIPVLLTIFFVIVVVGVTGENTTAEALIGLKQYFQDGVITFALIFGLITVVTSFLVISQSLREVYWWDLKINNNFSWFLACGIPFLLYLLGISNLIKIIGLTGSIVGGIFGIILILLLFRVKTVRKQTPALNNKLTIPMAIALCCMFFLGLVYELWYFFN